MTSLTIYYGPKFIRPIIPLKLINYLKINADKVDITTSKGKVDFEQNFNWHRVPCLLHKFDTSSNIAERQEALDLNLPDHKMIKITECLAVCHYLINYSQNKLEIKNLIGDEFMKQAQILKWSSLAVSDLLLNQVNYIGPNIGIRPWNKALVDQSMINFNILLTDLEKQLTLTKNLTGDKITLGDLLTMGTLSFSIKNKFNKDWDTKYPNLNNWSNRISDSVYFNS